VFRTQEPQLSKPAWGTVVLGLGYSTASEKMEGFKRCEAWGQLSGKEKAKTLLALTKRVLIGAMEVELQL